MANVKVLNRGTRTSIVGRSGSGKSTVASQLLRESEQQWILIDPKEDDKLDKLPKSVRLRDLDVNKVAKLWKQGAKYVLVTPHSTDPMEQDAFLMEMFDSFKGFGVYVDELYFIHKQGRCGPGLQTILTRGRSEGVTFFGATQRPAWVSIFCLSEATAIIQMDLNLAADRKRMYEAVGKEQALNNPPVRYSFYMYDMNANTVRLFQPPT